MAADTHTHILYVSSELYNFQVTTLISTLFSPAEVAHQFQYAVRVIGSNYAPTIERDEFLVSEKIKKECKWHLDRSCSTMRTHSYCKILSQQRRCAHCSLLTYSKLLCVVCGISPDPKNKCSICPVCVLFTF